jgi:hypothetical protein
MRGDIVLFSNVSAGGSNLMYVVCQKQITRQKAIERGGKMLRGIQIQFHHLTNDIGVSPRLLSSACDKILQSSTGSVVGGSGTLPYL